MSKRYVIQVLDTVTDKNCQDVSDIATSEPGTVKTAWFNVQHPAGGDWMTRSSQTAMRDAARMYLEGETREMRLALSKPVYVAVPIENGSYEHIKMCALITADLKDEVAKHGFGETGDADYVAPAVVDEVDEVDEDDDEEDSEYDGEDDDTTSFEVVNEDKK
jgi:hypothetical protein